MHSSHIFSSPPKYLYDPKSPLPSFYDLFDLSTAFKNVYEPAEDSFLLIDAISADLAESAASFGGQRDEVRSVEIGCGSGLVTCCFLEEVWKRGIGKIGGKRLEHFCVDVNADAVELTLSILSSSHLDTKFKTTVLQNDLLSSLPKFDVIIFNPPYVTTDSSEYKKSLEAKDIYCAWAGGKNGSETIKRFIEELDGHLYDDSVIYLLLSIENECDFIEKRMKEKHGLEAELLMKRKAGDEELAVVKFRRK